jgi:3-hydroxyisobutyrate dehydrogenase-like beta-hydroxyacid dehydrogenase
LQYGKAKIMQIAFLGLGIMGQAMAGNLINAGHQLIVWNRTAQRCAALIDRGAQAAASPAEAVAAAELAITMVADPAAARDVVFGPQGVLEGLAPGQGYIDMSTVDPQCARDIDLAIRTAGGRFLEAPVSGSRKPAEEGRLVILAGGDQELYEEAVSLFTVLGKKHLFLGEVGKGAAMKLLVNMTMGGMMGLLCEALALGERCDLPATTILDILGAGAIANPMFALKGAAIAADRHPTHFPLKHMQKDLRLAVALGDEKQQSLALVASANELFKRALAQGDGELDFSAVARAISRCNPAAE